MDHQSEAVVIRAVCVEFLGEHLGSQLAALARPGFGLSPAGESRPAAGRSRLGGPPLLDPGTPWPHDDDLPLSLFAVLDTDELTPWLGDELPVRPGLLNFFGIDHLQACRVVPADPTRAAPVRPPDDDAFAVVPLHAEPCLSLPDAWWGATLEDFIEGFGLDPGPDLTSICDPSEQVTELFAGDFPGEHYPGSGAVDQAFGWPPSVQPGDPLPDLRGEYTHLLRLSSNLGEWEFAEGGSLHFLIPRKALRDGDFSQAVVASDDG
ncbi:DUF1963 domain-containing protein [Actinoallomurus sp. NPDC050550]|uniref:DUF1963 domain-containing protein n=1 Tax=Actinoallomurus sp. NPDC050550 TaxID=3154937 RepID=UPI0033ECFDEF